MTLHLDLMLFVPMEISRTCVHDFWALDLHTPSGDKIRLAGEAILPLLKLRGEVDSLLRALGYESEIPA